MVEDDWGIVFFTNKKIAFSEGNWIRFRIIHINWATDMSFGTKNLRLSISDICELGTRSTITFNFLLVQYFWNFKKNILTGILSGYFVRIFSASIFLCSYKEIIKTVKKDAFFKKVLTRWIFLAKTEFHV